MTDEHTSNRDWVDLLLLAAIGVVWILLFCGVLVMLREPYDTVMYVHFLWRRAWFAVVLVLWVVLAGLRIWLRAKGDCTPRKRRQRRALDGLLLLGVAALPVMLFLPLTDMGHDALRPGAQVCRQYPAPGGTRSSAAGAQLNYLLYLPTEYTEGRRWPLVVFLHGGGAIGDNLLFVRAEGLPNQIERGKQFPFILLSPQVPRHRWNLGMMVALIEDVSRTLPVDRDRVYLTGISMGGFGTWRIASQHPDRFAAIAPLCGGGEVQFAPRLVNLPIWAFHGAKDDRVPLSGSQEMVDAVTKCGGQAKLTVYPDAGHDIDDLTYRNDQLYQWLLAQRRQSAQRPNSPPAPRGRGG